MTYPAVPDHHIPYDNDGTVVARWSLLNGVLGYATGAEAIEANDADMVEQVMGFNPAIPNAGLIWFFPEQREVTAAYYIANYGQSGFVGFTTLQGSNDTTNGLDGTWETASLPSGAPTFVNDFSWREGIKPVSFTGGKRTVRVYRAEGTWGLRVAHLYGEKVAGQTPNDIIYIDHDTTPGVEFASVEDFGDRPLGTTVTRQFRIKNVSPTLTANDINIQCNDTDFVISTDGSTWVVTINIASLAAGAESATMYIRNTTPAPGALLGPRYGRIVTIVDSWS